MLIKFQYNYQINGYDNQMNQYENLKISVQLFMCTTEILPILLKRMQKMAATIG